MKFEIHTDKIIDNVVSEVLEKKIDGKTLKQWMVEIAKHQWISVKDRLPEDEYECLVVNKSGYYWIGWFKADEERWVIDGTICGDGYITHWMPLPEAPKGDDEDG